MDLGAIGVPLQAALGAIASVAIIRGLEQYARAALVLCPGPSGWCQAPQACAMCLALQTAPWAHARVQAVPGGVWQERCAPPFGRGPCQARDPRARGLALVAAGWARAGVASVRGCP